MFKKEYIIPLSYLLCIVFLFFSIQRCDSERRESIKKDRLLLSLNDTVKVWKDKDGLNHSKISSLEVNKVKDFLNLQSKDILILELQNRVKKHQDKISGGGSLVIVKGETVYDTVYDTKDSIIYLIGNNTILDSISNKWIKTKFGFDKGKTVFNLKVKHDYTIILGEERKGFLKPKLPFLEVIDHNPYSFSDTIRVLNVKDTRSKFKLDYGVYGGFGATWSNNNILFGPQVGLGITVNF